MNKYSFKKRTFCVRYSIELLNLKHETGMVENGKNRI